MERKKKNHTHTHTHTDTHTHTNPERQRSKRKHHFWVHNIIKQRFEQGAYHNLIQKLRLEFIFFVIALHHVCQHLGNFTSCSHKSNVTTKKCLECKPRPLCAAEAALRQHESLHGVKKILQQHRMLLRYRTAWSESVIHIFYVPDFCRCHFCTVSVPHV